MGNRPPPRPNKKCPPKKIEVAKLGFILFVFGLVSIAAFFLPPRYWILLLAGVLIYCGYKLSKQK